MARPAASRRSVASRPSRSRSSATACSPLTHSALSSTALPRRGRDRTTVHNGVHPGQRVPVGALGQQVVGRVDADAVPGARGVGEDHAVEGADQLGREVDVAGRRDVAPDRVQVPQRGVGGVVLGATGVGRVGQHPLGERRGVRAEQLAPLVGPAGGQEQTLVRDHRVPRPGPEPRIAGHDVRPGDDEGVGGQRERPGHRVGVGRDERGGPAPGRRDDLRRRRRWRVERARPGGDLQRAAGVHSGRNRPGRNRSSTGFSPRAASSRWCTPWYQAPSASKPGPATRYAPSTTTPSAVCSTRRSPPAADRSPCASRQVHSGSSGQAHRPAGQDGVHDGDRGVPVPHRQGPLDDDVADPPAPPGQAVADLEALQQGVPGRVDRPEAHSWVPSLTRAPEGSVSTGSSEASAIRRTEPPVPRHDQQSVVAARAQAARRAHRVAAEPVGDEPFPRGARAERPAHLGPVPEDAHGLFLPHPPPGPPVFRDVDRLPRVRQVPAAGRHRHGTRIPTERWRRLPERIAPDAWWSHARRNRRRATRRPRSTRTPTGCSDTPSGSWVSRVVEVGRGGREGRAAGWENARCGKSGRGAASGWRRRTPGTAPGGRGGRTCPSGPGAPSARTTATTARPGTTFRTTTPVAGVPVERGRPGRHLRRAADVLLRARALERRATGSSRSASSGWPGRRATTARMPRSTGGTWTPPRPTPGCAGATTIRRRRFPYGDLVAANAARGRGEPEFELVDTGIFDGRLLVGDGRLREGVADRHVRPDHGREPRARSRRPCTCCRRCGSATRGPGACRAGTRCRASTGTTGGTLVARHRTLGRMVLAGEGDPARAVLRQRVQRGPAVGAGQPVAVPQGRHQRPRGRRLADGQPRPGRHQGGAALRRRGPARQSREIRLRLAHVADPADEWSPGSAGAQPRPARPGSRLRRGDGRAAKEADEFFADVTPPAASADEAMVLRQAVAGLMWGKQFYHYDVARWLTGDPAGKPPAPTRHAQPALGAHVQLRRHLHARSLGVPVVRRLGPGLPVRRHRARRPGLRQGAAAAPAARLVHAPQRAAARRTSGPSTT